MSPDPQSLLGHHFRDGGTDREPVSSPAARRMKWHGMSVAQKTVLVSTFLTGVTGFGHTAMHALDEPTAGTTVTAPVASPVPAVGGYKAIAADEVPTFETQYYHDEVFNGYAKGKGKLDQAVNEAAGQADPASRRLTEWKEMIDSAKTLSDPLAKAVIVHEWVAKVIKYDDYRPAAVEDDIENTVQTPQKTLERGMGRCGDLAALVAESDLRAGVPRESVGILVMKAYFQNTGVTQDHAAVDLSIGGRKFVSDPLRGFMTEDDYFARPAGQIVMQPAYEVNPDGRRLNTYGDSRVTLAKLDYMAIEVRLDAKDTAAYQAVQRSEADAAGEEKYPYSPQTGTERSTVINRSLRLSR